MKHTLKGTCYVNSPVFKTVYFIVIKIIGEKSQGITLYGLSQNEIVSTPIFLPMLTISSGVSETERVIKDLG